MIRVVKKKFAKSEPVKAGNSCTAKAAEKEGRQHIRSVRRKNPVLRQYTIHRTVNSRITAEITDSITIRTETEVQDHRVEPDQARPQGDRPMQSTGGTRAGRKTGPSTGRSSDPRTAGRQTG